MKEKLCQVLPLNEHNKDGRASNKELIARMATQITIPYHNFSKHDITLTASLLLLKSLPIFWDLPKSTLLL